MLQTVQTNAFVGPAGLLLWAAINWSHSSVHTPAVHWTVIWLPFTTVWLNSHPIACSFQCLLHLVLRTIFKWASYIICLVAVLAVSWLTTWNLCSCCSPLCDVSDEIPIDQLIYPISPGWSVCVSMFWWCAIGEADDNQKKWEILRNMSLPSSHDARRQSQVVCSTQVESCCVRVHVAGVSHCPATHNMLVWHCVFVSKDTLRCTTAEIV